MSNLKDMPEAYELIMNRKSIRSFSDQPVSDDLIEAILKAGQRAPSGKNNQPWRFVIVTNREVRMLLAGETHYGSIVAHAPVVLPVFIDREAVYDTLKDHQAIGACLENMLLASQALGLGAVWLGEILKNKEAVRNHLGLDPRYDLMAVLAIGYPKETGKEVGTSRKPLKEAVLKRFA
jgi:nitroreductase